MNVTDEILHYLPHRYPFLLVDRVLEFTPGVSLKALKNVTRNEPFFPGHFPGDPVMPGVLIIEAMAQAACLMTLKNEELTANIKTNVIYLVGIDEARFKQMVKPGDQLILTTEYMWNRRGIWRAKCTATVKDEIVCSAELTGAWGKRD